ncbi:MAG TPA: helix-turn-helix transcriptional regulator [Patescibacteria group bacterium]|nr:helix-turn-helix transcriptional regulator [Patescibacteria group bacterium]
MQISKLVKNLRDQSEFTLDVLAKKTGLSAGFLSRLEKGNYDNKNIQLETIIRLANGLGQKLKDFLDNLQIIDQNELPPLNLYLREKYKIKKDSDIKTIEDIINKFTDE